MAHFTKHISVCSYYYKHTHAHRMPVSLDAFGLWINQSALETVPFGLISTLLQIEVGVGSGQRYKGDLAYPTGH